ncbi:MAG: lipopolysaccharide assembly protein LapA domain-containing protein, partial [Shimia sp.]
TGRFRLMRYIKIAFLVLVAIALIVLALANRAFVTLKTMPEGLLGLPGANLLAFDIQLPLFAVIFGGVALGVVVGYVWEWLREMKHRAEVTRREREVRRLKGEVRKLRGEKHQGKDEVLALIDET